MKKSNILLACLYLSLDSWGQTNNTSLTFISEIPIIAETALYTDTLHYTNKIHTLSGRIRIALAPRRTAILTREYIQGNDPYPVSRMAGIEYACYINSSDGLTWKPVPYTGHELAAFPYGGLIADTVLNINDSLILRFRDRITHVLVQQHIFRRPELNPSLWRVRKKTSYDSVGSKIQARGFQNKKESWAGFDTVNGNTITLEPGENLDLVFKNLKLNSDSCLEYRVYRSGEQESGWLSTGHFLSLARLKPNTRYTLEVRYSGMGTSGSYLISVRPRWFETTTAIICIAVTIAVLLVLIPSFIYRYRLRREQNKHTRLQEQLKTLQNQLNPHFVYNALSSIKGLIAEKENEKANEYLSTFADIMRNTMNNSGELYVSMAEDIGMLEKYIQLEQMRFGFKYVIDKDSELNLELIEFPPMLLQPTVENSVKHGVAGMGEAGEVRIGIMKKGNDMIITISDNGARHDGKKNRSNGSGIGLELTRERMKTLRQLFTKQHPYFTIERTALGTTTTFYFQNWIE